ncbi:ATP-binding protein [Actinoallomurus rhizosphaericola]|uniref:ATP-binding protein n=1 Tax=Actinoallomurus rhizosphaericola TaxID=2952536 RepID=UPI00209008E0|nr:LuxR family transcriptional regulator [Actinoallomurus rhizosphaericola]MCO5992127.1 LuxR family transcriptional regulator [Actinoallomurus rhizosphaericola]
MELSTLEEGSLLVPTVAAAVGIREMDRQAMPLLLGRLADKRMLLLLDGCEHLLESCASLVDRLLRAAPRLRIMATSRHRLGVLGEQVLPIASLPVADEHAPTRSIARNEAVRLFTDRAVTVCPGFSVTSANAVTVARISQRLDGIPLAIELAATRLRNTPLDRLLGELDDRFAVLTGGDRDAPPRQQTLRATMDWSRSLCSPAERHLWARLATFPGGVDLDTAEETCAGGEIEREEIFDLIAGLVDKSVLTTECSRIGTRYRMLDSIRAYGRENLTGTEEKRLRGRCCAHYRSLVERCRIDQMTSDQLDRFHTLQTELPNLRAAMEACYGRPASAPAGLEVASALWGFWLLGGALTEGRHWLERGLRLVPEPGRARLTALWADALLALHQRDLPAAGARIEECQTLAEETGDATAAAFATTVSGIAALSAGDDRRGLALLEQARLRHWDSGDLNAVGINLYLASMFCVARDPDLGAALGEELMALCDARDAPLFRAYALFAIGIAAWKQGDWRRAETMMLQVAAPWSVIEDRWGLAQFLEVLAWTAGAGGAQERAARLLGAADRVWHELGFSPTQLPYHACSHQQCETRARESLGSRAFGREFRGGARLDLTTAVADALDEG